VKRIPCRGIPQKFIDSQIATQPAPERSRERRKEKERERERERERRESGVA